MNDRFISSATDSDLERGKRGGQRLAAILFLAAGSCQVINPGNILDEDLDTPEAMPAVVNGVAAKVADALNGNDHGTVFYGAALFGELFATTTFEVPRQAMTGMLPPDRPDYSNVLDESHATGRIAEHGVERIQRVLPDQYASHPLAAEANLWAGFANRNLGEIFCSGVIDGGPELDRIEYFRRAEAYFTEAINIAEAAGASEILYAAYGGRASVRTVLGDLDDPAKWDGAVVDAAMVPSDFVFEAEFNRNGSTAHPQTNIIWRQNWVRKDLTVKFTWFEQYFRDNPQDTRVAWKERLDADGNPVWGAGPAAPGDKKTPVLLELKYQDGTADVPLTKGAEMRLIRAEAEIRDPARWSVGLQRINELRGELGLPPRQATSQQEAFEWLRLERAIALWLEARRGSDLYRWRLTSQQDTIVTTMAQSAIAFGHGSILVNDRALCFLLSETVRNTNPNL